MTDTILVVDDEERLADVLAATLDDLGFRALACYNASDALALMSHESVDLVLSDLRLPDMDGRQLMHEVRRRWPDVPVIIITAFSAMRDAVDLVKEGAFDYISKPFEIEDVTATIRRALHLTEVIRDNERLRRELEGSYSFERLIGSSEPFRKVITQIAEVCESRVTVLLQGESGTGKEVVARAIHFNSPRRAKPFVAVNCAAIPEGLLESELFGHVRGAFTGAVADRKGRFQLADEGTLFLDEIGDMPVSIQAKILRVLQEREFEMVGDHKTRKVDVRIIAATHKDLKQGVAEGTFRDDLYYRLNVFPIALPALRQRKDDIPVLAAHFLKEFAQSMGRQITGFTPDAMVAMASYNWPGNIRELQNCIERAVIVTRGHMVDVPQLPAYLFEASDGENPTDTLPGAGLDEALEAVERSLILKALEETDGVQVRAAERLGINERSLWHRIKKLDIKILKKAGQ